MPKKNYYLLSEGILKRKENTIYFVNQKGKKPLPINKIYSVYDFYKKLYKDEILDEINQNKFINPSSSSW